MKKIITLLLLSLVLLSACGSADDAQALKEEDYRTGKDVFFLFTSPG